MDLIVNSNQIHSLYEFEKISENEIRYIQASSTSTILTKQ